MEKIILELNRDELKLLAGMLMLNYMDGFRSVHKDFQKTGMDLAQKVSLLDLRQYAKK